MGRAIFTQICSLRQGSISYNTIIDKTTQLKIPRYCPNNHISVLFIPDRSFQSSWTQKGDLKLRPQSSQIFPFEGTVFMNRVLNVNKRHMLLSLRGVLTVLYSYFLI